MQNVSVVFLAPANLIESTTPAKSRPPHVATYSPKLVQSRLKEVLIKHCNGLWVSKLPQLYRELYKQDLPIEALKDLEQWTHICTVRIFLLWLVSLWDINWRYVCIVPLFIT